MQKRIFGGHLVGCDKTSIVTLLDTIAVVSAYGLLTKRIMSHAGMTDILKELLEGTDPVVCEVMINPDMQTAPRLSSMVMFDGKIVSKLLEDLWTFLDRDEFEENMIINALEE